jgi:tetratricopeptide (TPR) repeat protein
MSLPRVFLLLFALFVCPLASAQDLTLDELKVIVAEIEAVAEKHPRYKYPIEVSIAEDDAVNASAGVRLAGEDLQAVLIVNTGFIKAVKADPVMMRAVVAHEMAHLALGHALESSHLGDLSQALTRQQEFAADAMGATYLEATGHNRSEMVQLLHFLDSILPRGFPIWLGTVGSDHASPITRATLIDGDSKVLSALSRLEVGAAFMECRRYAEAILWFEAALAIEPRMSEAHLNIALATLQDYYERLPSKVQGEWLRPAFLSHLTSTTLLGGRSIEVTDKDLARYKKVLERIADVPDAPYATPKAFLLGTLEVLHPSGDKATIEQGVQRLLKQQVLMVTSLPRSIQEDQLRLVNNVAVGLHRLGRSAEAQSYLVSQSLKTASIFERSAAENIGRLPYKGLDKDQALQALSITVTYVSNTPPNAPNFDVVKSTMQELLSSLNRKLNNEIAPQALYLCQAVSMMIDGNELLLFDPVNSYALKLGKPGDSGFLLEKYPDLQCVMWGNADVVLLCERGQVLKITSYRPDSAIVLKPTNSSSREQFVIRVGMTEEELITLIGGSGAQSTSNDAALLGRSAFIQGADAEAWQYYPALNFGALLKDGKVIGLSVTPVKG